MTQQWKPIPAALYDLILTGDMEAILWQLKGVREAETVRMILYNARQTILSTSAPVDVQEDRKQVARKAIEWATPSNVMASPLVACEHIRGMAALVLTPPASAQDDAKDERQAFETAMGEPLRMLLGPGAGGMNYFDCTEYDSAYVQAAWLAWQTRSVLKQGDA